MESNKVISMNAWTSKDKEASVKIEEGSVEIHINNCEIEKGIAKISLPLGSKLNPQAEISNLLQLCQNFESRPQREKSAIAKRINACVTNIQNASNKEAFAEVILTSLERKCCEEAKQRLFIIGRKLCSKWSEAEKARLAKICMDQLMTELEGYHSTKGVRINTNQQAIYTLSMCGNKKQLEQLCKLRQNSQYTQACLYTHGKTKTAIDWLWESVQREVTLAKKRKMNHLQTTSHAIGIALRKNEDYTTYSKQLESQVVVCLTEAIQSGAITPETLISVILAIGCICDKRYGTESVEQEVFNQAFATILGLNRYYKSDIVFRNCKAIDVVRKMMIGQALNKDEEQFLLEMLDKE